MDRLKAILKASLEDYAGEALNGYFYLTADKTETLFAIISLAKISDERIVNAGIIVHIEENLIIIEKDISNKPLVEALVQNGVPREQIILAYAGEAVPTPG